jgi:GT2 family glycosyltransferase
VRLDVIVPCWGQHKLTHRLLSSFAKHAPDWVGLILVDNARGVPDPVRPPSGRLPRQRLVVRNSQNLGFIRAVNQGICASDADYICIQNNDTEIFRGCYERLMSDLLANPDVAVISPIASEGGSAWLSVDELQKRWDWFPREIPKRHVDRAHFFSRYQWPVEGQIHRPSMVPFFCALMPRATIDRFGLLDTRYGLGLADDDDYCKRIADSEMTCGLSLGTYIWHQGAATFASNYTPEQIEEQRERNKAAFNEKWGTSWV